MRKTCLWAGNPEFAKKGNNQSSQLLMLRMVAERHHGSGRSLRWDNAVDTCCCSNMVGGGTSEKNEVNGYAIQEGCTNWALDR